MKRTSFQKVIMWGSVINAVCIQCFNLVTTADLVWYDSLPKYACANHNHDTQAATKFLCFFPLKEEKDQNFKFDPKHIHTRNGTLCSISHSTENGVPKVFPTYSLWMTLNRFGRCGGVRFSVSFTFSLNEHEHRENWQVGLGGVDVSSHFLMTIFYISEADYI